MYLINTTTITLERADDKELASIHYAILSHTWGEDEATFDDMLNGEAERREGYVKILNTCRLAKQRGFAYAWIDTCCVDKRSSAELAEAINSMFQWYKRSAVCFVILEDLEPNRYRGFDDMDGLESCRWFTRGWTLQELIASPNLEFYDREWNNRGAKSQWKERILDITGIPMAVLEDNNILEAVPVAMRMSWAANRETTREEDLAYCLLGIFDVNMPMLYGEGTKAFGRLQEEIIKGTTDLSIFAWKAKDTSQAYRGILAESPAEFAHCRNLYRAPTMRYGIEYSMTNKGLRLETCLGESADKEYLLNLTCMFVDDLGGEGPRIGVYLARTADGYVRTRPSELFETQDSLLWAGPRHKIFIRKRVTPFGSTHLKRLLSKNLTCTFDISPHFQLSAFAAKPADLWDSLTQAFITDRNKKFTGFLNFQVSHSSSKGSPTARIYVICGLTEHMPSATLKAWMGIYSSLDKEISGGIIDCVDGYYNSYGEESYLHKLRDCVMGREGDLPQETTVRCGDKWKTLHMSLEGRVNSDGSFAITVNIKP